MTIIVTGAAGFIGSNIVKALNQRGETNIIAVDNLTNGHKFRNLATSRIIWTNTNLSAKCANTCCRTTSAPCSTKARAATPWNTTGNT